MLHIAIAIAVFVGVIWAMVVFPSFRIVVLILGVVGGIGYFVLSEKTAGEKKQQEATKAQEKAEFDAKFETEQKAYCQAEQKRWTVVTAAEIEIRDTSLSPRQSTYSDDYSIAAAVKNNSKSRVTGLRMNVTALDCPKPNSRPAECDVVGRGNETLRTDIPAGEVRQVNGKVTLRDLPKPRGVFTSRFSVNAVRAPLDDSDDSHKTEIFGRFLYQCN